MSLPHDVACVGLQFVIVAFPGHTHLRLYKEKEIVRKKSHEIPWKWKTNSDSMYDVQCQI